MAAKRIPTPLDLVVGVEYAVRHYRHGDRAPELLFEGSTTFDVRPLPYMARLGDRYELVASCAPNYHVVAAARAGTSGVGYRVGDSMIELCEAEFLVLVDREVRVSGPDLRTRLEMSLDTFCVAEGLDGVTFE